MAKIPFISLHTEQSRRVLTRVMEKLPGLVESSQFILGEEVQRFERAFASLNECSFGVGVNSGLDALVLALRALGIGPGDEVITVPNSFVASVAAIALVGATPVLVDVGADYNIDPEQAAAAVTPRTRAILPVHLTGNPCRMDRLVAIAQAHDLFLVPDAAQAVGAKFRGKSIGCWGDVVCFSLHPLKNLHVWGDGGIITTDDSSLAEQLKLQRNHGLVHRDESVFFSYNSRLDSFQAMVASAFLEHLEEILEARRENAALYLQRLATLEGELTLPRAAREAEPAYHVFQVWTQKREALQAFLLGKGIETKVHYPVPIHLQEAGRSLGYPEGTFPVAERLARGILSLPIRENLTRDELNRICDAVEVFFRH